MPHAHIASSHKLDCGYIIRSTHILAAGNSHEHLAIHETIPS